MHMNQIRKLLKRVNALFGSDRELLAFLIGPLNAGSGEQNRHAVFGQGEAVLLDVLRIKAFVIGMQSVAVDGQRLAVCHEGIPVHGVFPIRAVRLEAGRFQRVHVVVQAVCGNADAAADDGVVVACEPDTGNAVVKAEALILLTSLPFSARE